ncbi:MAG: Asp23/Gls24 family envelope stress response protein [Bacilli bacterium]|jgi:uncharacterized alkaline shock family protein YloU|nr:Asp23/Gls24 family envelope stress response protein [Bacilli bacterium]
MGIDKTTPLGAINISIEAIARVAGDAAQSCYGVVGLADKRSLKQGLVALLKPQEYVKGIYCHHHRKTKGYEVDVYIVAAYGVKITEVLSEVQKRIRYELEKAFAIPFQYVNVYVQGVKEIK